MPDIDITKSRGKKYIGGASPIVPAYVDGETPPPNNPPGSGSLHPPVTIGTPANGLSLSGQQLSLALSSTSTIGALSDTDWNTFNNKVGGSGVNQRIAFWSGTNTISSNSLLTFDGVKLGFGNNTFARGATGGLVISSDLASSNNIFFRPNGDVNLTGQTSIDSGGNVIIGGTLRVQLIANEIGNFATYSATGILQQRTAAQVLSDIGAQASGNYVTVDLPQTITGLKTIQNSQYGTFIIDRTASTNTTIEFRGSGVNQGYIGTDGVFFAVTNSVLSLSSAPFRVTRSNGNIFTSGTLRVSTINNLGSTPASVLVPSATGVVSSRTLAEFVSDAGISNLWTDATTHIYRNGKVVIGTTTLDANSTLEVVSTLSTAGNKFIKFKQNGGTTVLDIDSANGGLIQMPLGILRLGSPINPSANGLSIRSTSSTGTDNFFLLESFAGTRLFNVSNNGIAALSSTVLRVGNPTDIITGGMTVKGGRNDAGIIYRFLNSDETRLFQIAGNGDITLSEGADFILGTTTGTKIGTSTTQKLAFWNKTPILQPTTAITGVTLVGGGGTTITDTDTFGGYTLAQLAAIIINTGLAQ